MSGLRSSGFVVSMALIVALASCRSEPVEPSPSDAAEVDAAQGVHPDAAIPDAPSDAAPLDADADAPPDAEAAPDAMAAPDAEAAPDSTAPDAGPVLLDIQPAALPGAVSGAPYAVGLSVAGGSGAGYTWSIVQGALPPGLSLAHSGASTASISGSAIGPPGHYAFTVAVTDGAMNGGARDYDVAVRDPEPELAAYTGDLEQDGRAGAYLTDITPTVPTWTAIQPVLSASVARAPRIDLSPDKAWVAFIADYDQPPATDVYLVPITSGQPGAPLRISPAGSNVDDLAWSHDGTRLVYSTTGASGADPAQVFVVDTSGPVPSAPQEIAGLTGPLVGPLRVSPTANVLLIEQLGVLFATDLTTLPAAAARISSGFVTAERRPFSPGGQRFVFEETWAAPGGTTHQFFAADLSGGTELATIIGLTPPLFVSEAAPAVRVVVSPDGQRLAYSARVDRATREDLYVVEGVDATPSAPRRITASLGPDESATGPRWSPSSAHLSYRVTSATGVRAYVDEVASGAAPAPQRIDAPPPGTTSLVAETGFSSDGQLLWFKMLGPTPSLDLYVRPFNNGTLGPQRLLRPAGLPADFGAGQVFFNPDGRALLVSHISSSSAWRVHAYALSGTTAGPAREVSLPPLAGVRLGNCFWSRDPRRAILSFVTFDPSFAFGLYAADLAAPAVVPVRLGPAPVPGGSAVAFDLEAFGE